MPILYLLRRFGTRNMSRCLLALKKSSWNLDQQGEVPKRMEGTWEDALNKKAKGALTFVRTIASGDKNRLQSEEYDLDLTCMRLLMYILFLTVPV